MENPNYGNSVFFSPRVERLLHEHLRGLHGVMRKFSATEDDLKFPEKWFTGVEIRGGLTWAGPDTLRCPMLTDTMSDISKRTRKTEMIALLQQLKELH